MDLPNRIKQHKNESDSYAILLYKLREIGIFRNYTENDYGIDFEIEIVRKEKVTGRYLKAQVKSSIDLTIRQKDSVPTVGGIKQSTLLYWAELSYKTHVIAYAVDLKTENIYLSKPLFWQVTALLENSKKTKTIEFLPNKDEHNSKVALVLTGVFASSPSLMDEIYNHKMALKYLSQFFTLYADVFHYDAPAPVGEIDVFEVFLEVSRVLLWSKQIDFDGLNADEKKYLYDYSYWKQVTETKGVSARYPPSLTYRKKKILKSV